MDSLLCDEVWLSSPSTPDDCYNDDVPQWRSYVERNTGLFYTTKEDCKQALSLCLDKEVTYMPKHGYVQQLLLSKELLFLRLRSIQWLIKSRSRLNLSYGTIFNAANYLDRFISMNPCHEWKCWMAELLSVVCLSVSSKLSETYTPSLVEIQMEDLDHSFDSITIQQMELKVLKALGWRLSSTTAYSYVELMAMNIDCLNPHLQRRDLVSRITELLLGAMLDCKLVEYRPSIAAASALWCSLEELLPSNSDAHLIYITRLFDQDWKNDLVECHNMMEARLIHPLHKLACGGEYSCYCPSSPVTVLLNRKQIEICDSGHVDLASHFKKTGLSTNLFGSHRKRKREEQ